MRSSASFGRVLLALLLMMTTLAIAAHHEQRLRLAVPVEPIEAILDAFNSHAIVALGEGLHGNEQGHAFRLALIRDPRFAGTVNDIVVEFGSAHNQELIDRFVRGGSVSDAELRHVWQDTTQLSGVWDKPIYEEFFRAVRALNVSLPRDRQLRVLLGDPPVDWGAALKVGSGTARQFGQPVQSFPDPALNRDRHAAEVVRREVLAKQRRALLIFGGMHLIRWRTSIVGILESESATRVFNVSNAIGNSFHSLNEVQGNVSSWPVPSLAKVAGTTLMQREFSYFDAVLYLGAPSAITFSRLPLSLCSDPSYIKMRKERLAISGWRDKADELLIRNCPTLVPQ